MKYNKLSVAVAAFAFAAVSAQNSNVLKYPETKKVSHTDTYFGTQVSDPYRWLEDDRAEDTKAWVQQEVKFTQDYLAQIPFRDQLKKQLMDIWNYEKISAPFKKVNTPIFLKMMVFRRNLYFTEKMRQVRRKYF